MALLSDYIQEHLLLGLCALVFLQILFNFIILFKGNHGNNSKQTIYDGGSSSIIGENSTTKSKIRLGSTLTPNETDAPNNLGGGHDVISMTADYARRGQLWSKHPSWVLDAPRAQNNKVYGEGIGHVIAILKKYDVDPLRGFLPSQDPLQRLSYARYHIWEDLCDDLPKLLGARLGQARGPLSRLPVLSIDKLVTDEELRRAHLLLCLFAHAYVWGGVDPIDEIPEGIAVPLWQVSKKLDIPPVLGHPSIVLYNWRRLDVEGDICMENLSTLNNFFDGRDESWFYLITVEIEARGAAAVVPMMLATDAIQRHLEDVSERKQEERDLEEIHTDAEEDISGGGPDEDNMANKEAAAVAVVSADAADDFETKARSLSQSSSIDERLDGVVDERLLLPSVAFSLDSSSGATAEARRSRSGSESGSRRKRGLRPKLADGGRYLLSSLAASPKKKTLRSKLRGSANFAPNEALVGTSNVNRVAEYVAMQLDLVAAAVKGMCDSLESMREGCHPFIFYHRVRPFLSAWKQNPTLPKGVVYKGVSSEPMKFYGGSAAQSSLIPFLDIGLRVTHDSSKSQDFLLAMREYMTRNHREFLVYMKQVACIRQFIIDGMIRHGIEIGQDATLLAPLHDGIPTQEAFALTSVDTSLSERMIWLELRDTYDRCIDLLKKFRSTHINLVTEYIMSQQKKGVEKKTLQGSAGGKGTGGTDLMSFLKPLRDNCGESLLSSPAAKPEIVDKTTYIKDNADLGDIDVYGQWGPLERERYGW